MPQTIKQLEEKNVPSEIKHMVWCTRVDLVAFSNAKGEVALHRLAWTRAWVLTPPEEGVAVNGIAWKPDGKVLAIAYDNSTVILVNIETKAVVTKFQVPGEISFISWVQEKAEVKPKGTYGLKEEDKEALKFVDLAKPYIKDPPPVSHLEGAINFEDIKGLSSFLQEQSEFNLLLVGTREGIINFRVFGCWSCLNLDVGKKTGNPCAIENAHLTEDLSKLFVTARDTSSGNLNTILFDTEIFSAHSAELYHVTMKYIKLHELMLYLGKVLTSITETWESILLEFDTKLAKYAGQVPEGGVTADFMELLMFGICSEPLQEFLLMDLSKKGLEKFGQTMEVSYSNIQSYLFRHIIKFSQNGTLHLSELKGMAAFEQRFGIIGLNEPLIQKSILSNGAFVIKASEMQQIINHSVINYKAFFRWLYASIMQLMDEPVPADIQKMTQQDLACIAEFVRNFDDYGRSDRKRFIMERVGQYLLEQDLKIKADMRGNDWTQFVVDSECLKGNYALLSHYLGKSLVQVYKELKGNIDEVFESPLEAIERVVKPKFSWRGFQAHEEGAIVTSVNVARDILLMALVRPPKGIYFIEVHYSADGPCHARGAHFTFEPPGAPPSDVIDCQFYSASTLVVLLQERKGALFPLPVTCAIDHLRDVDLSRDVLEGNLVTVNAWPLGQDGCKCVEMPVSKFFVSGSRKVSIVLAENRRKVKIFEMERSEEEEEEEEEEN